MSNLLIRPNGQPLLLGGRPSLWMPPGNGLSSLLPPVMRGYGAATTGGRDGHLIFVTEPGNGTGADTIRWALEQYPGEPKIIVPLIEARNSLSGTLGVGDNISVLGGCAPGVGFYFDGDRIELTGDNILWDNMEHFGNDPSLAANSDCMGNGRRSTDPESNDVTNLRCIRNSGFYHSKDESLTFTIRANAQASGNRMTNTTVERCTICTPIGNSGEPPHNFSLFIGDGVERWTAVENLLSNASARNPFLRGNTLAIEFFNNAIYNFPAGVVSGNGVAPVNINSPSQCSFRNNLWRLGPVFQDDRHIITFDSNADQLDVYIDGNLVDSKIGETLSKPFYSTDGNGIPTLGSSQSFAGSGIELALASQVESLVAARAGVFGYGGIRRPYSQQHMSDFLAGDAPASMTLFDHGPIPTLTGDPYPDSNGANVPLEYIALGGGADPAAFIDDGSPWTGMREIERIEAFMKSSLFTDWATA